MSKQYEYNNRLGQGVRTSTTPSPRSIVEDFETRIQRLSPHAFPFQTLKNYFGSGKPPTAFKITTAQLHEYDHFDSCSSALMGTNANDETRYARFAPLQVSRPETGGQTLAYNVQDMLWIMETGQMVEVVVTPTESITLKSGAELALTTTITGNTTTRSVSGSIVVRNVSDAPLVAFTSGSDIINMGRTPHEGQNKGGASTYVDPIYDCNYVEMKESSLIFTEEQKNMIQTRWEQSDWDIQQEHTVNKHKQDVENIFFWGERSVDMNRPVGARRTMRGLFNAIQSNVTLYNPGSILDYEIFFRDVMLHNWFRYQGVRANNDKILLLGDELANEWSYAFSDYRRVVTMDLPRLKVSLNLDRYELLGKYRVTVIPHSMLRVDTKIGKWGFCIDPAVAKFRIRKDHRVEDNYANKDERLIKFLIEWQGTMSWGIEQTMGLVRTF